MVKTPLTINQVFKSQKYRNVLNLIGRFQYTEIKFINLRYALCKKHGIKLTDSKIKLLKDFFIDESSGRIKEYDRFLEEGRIDKKMYDILVAETKKSELHQMRKYGWLKEKYMFSSFQTLGNALARLKKLELIDTIDGESGGHKYYVLTDKGLIEFQKWYILWYIDTFTPQKAAAYKFLLEDIIFLVQKVRYLDERN